jgi:PAS domain S-box-containing protein
MDVTRRVQAEELFRVATEASPCGILLVDSDENIVLANAQVEELFGYLREEVIGKNINVLLTERDAAHYSTALPALRSVQRLGQNGAGKELFARRKNGTEFPVEMALNPIDTSQGLLVLATIVNLSARKAAEAEARQRRQQVDLLSRASLLGEMTASLAHELNQPLSAIVTNATAGIQYIDKGRLDAEQLREIFTDVAADGRRAYDIIDNVRSAIRKDSAIRTQINLNDVVQSVTHMVHPDAVAHFCRLEASLAENLPRVDGDPTQLQQVLINLIRNAFDAMHDTPPARRVVQIATSHNGTREVCVTVRDHGAGISETTRERLFEQFFTTKEGGLGMGLAIVRSIVEAHGGRIAAENADGGGARFYFHVPIQNEVLT